MRLKRACKKSLYCLLGGPFSAQWVYLTTPSTMVMNVGGVRGRYVLEKVNALRWEEL